MTLLGPDGQPVTPKPPEPSKAGPTVPLKERVARIQDGPIKVTVKMEFEDVVLGGPEADKFMSAIDAVLTRTNSVGVRLVELMLLGAQKGQHVAPFVIGAMEDLKLMRVGVEGLLSRVSRGLDPMPRVQVAQDVPPVSPQS